MILQAIWKEVQKQLTNTPSFSLKIPKIEKSQEEHLEHLDEQIEKALKDSKNRLVFLVGPFGSGKSTQIQYFLHKHPNLRYLHKSLVKVNTLDFAFLHLTNYKSRLFLMMIFSTLALLLMNFIPNSAALPFLVIIGFFFVKNSGNLVYILHEALDNLFSGKDRLVILEDFERSPLGKLDQWALLANLWQFKRSYLIALGYSTDDKKAKLQMIENAQKLGGIIIEIAPHKGLNHLLIKQLDPLFPFSIDEKEENKKGAWMSLFTLREMLMIKEQASLRNLATSLPENKQKQYIHVCLEFLLEKLELPKHQIIYNEKKHALMHFSPKGLTPEQAFFLSSFEESIQ